MSFIDYSSRKRGTSQAASSANSAHQPDQSENPFQEPASSNNNQEDAYNYNDQRNTVASYQSPFSEQQQQGGLQPGQIHDNRHFNVEVQHTDGEQGTHANDEQGREFFDPTFPSYGQSSRYLSFSLSSHVILINLLFSFNHSR